MWLFTWLKSIFFSWLRPVKKITPYEFKYPLNSILEETEEHKKYKRVEEETPEGKVIMTYDEPTNTFFYWSDKSIAYRYLEVVARKYVVVYDCKDIYINIFKELIKAKNKKEEVIEDKPSPFATFKSYNTSTHKLTNTKLVNERSNQYKRIGKWNDKKEEVVTYKSINYLEYKKQI